MKVTIHFDGSCWPNPGGVAHGGWTAEREDGKTAQGSQEIIRGKGATNNVAEWAALELALIWLASRKSPITRLDIFGDSQIVIRAINRRQLRKKMAEHLKPYAVRCWALLKGLGCPWKAAWVPRAKNVEADAQSRRTGLPGVLVGPRTPSGSLRKPLSVPPGLDSALAAKAIRDASSDARKLKAHKVAFQRHLVILGDARAAHGLSKPPLDDVAPF